MQFYVNDRVELREGSSYMEQSSGTEGIIIWEDIDDFWCRVLWDNGHEDSYPKDELVLIERGDDVPEVRLDECFSEGDIVRLKENSGYLHQSEGREGKIISINMDRPGWCKVEWSHGRINSYPLGHVILVSKHFTIGTRVRLKEDSRYYDQSEGNEGEVISISDTRSGWCKVKWLHGMSDNYPMEDLKLVSRGVGEVSSTGMKVVPGQIVVLKGGATAVVLPSRDNIVNMLIDEKEYRKYRFNESIEVLTFENELYYSVNKNEIIEVTEGFIDLVVYKISSDYTIVKAQNLSNLKIKKAIRDGTNIDYVGKIDVETSLELWNKTNN